MKKFMIIIAATAGLAASTALANASQSHGGHGRGHPGGGGGIIEQIIGEEGLGQFFRGRENGRRRPNDSSRYSGNQSNNFGNICLAGGNKYNISIWEPIGTPCTVDANTGHVIAR